MNKTLKKALIWIAAVLLYGFIVTLLSLNGNTLGGIPAALLFLVMFWLASFFTKRIDKKGTSETQSTQDQPPITSEVNSDRYNNFTVAPSPDNFIEDDQPEFQAAQTLTDSDFFNRRNEVLSKLNSLPPDAPPAEESEKSLRNQEDRIALSTKDGHLAWMPLSKAEAWRRGQEALERGDPETLEQKSWRADELKAKLLELASSAYQEEPLSRAAEEAGMTVAQYTQYLKLKQENERLKALKQQASGRKKSYGGIITIGVLLCVIGILVGYIIGNGSSGAKGPAEHEAVSQPPNTSPSLSPTPAPQPRSGEKILGYTTAGYESTITVKSSSNWDSYIVLKYSSRPDSDFSTSTSAIFAFYVRAGDEVVMTVPQGSATLFYATGEIWYGRADKFGETTSYSTSDDIFDFTNYTWEVTLYPVVNGNMDSYEIDSEDFPA